MRRYIKCPFYKDERKKSISCEDVCRHFSSHDDKWEWIDMYCDSWEWEKCPYAVDMTEAYYRKEKGEEKALEEHKIKAQKKEIHSLSTRLGVAEKKIERLQKVNETMFRKYKKAVDMLENYQKHESERYFAIATLYEDRIAYLIDRYCDGRLAEADVRAWAEGKEYALTFDKDYEDPEERVWIVMTRKESDADAAHHDRGVQGAAESEGEKAEE